MLTGEFRPRILPRTGEATAWGLTALLLAVRWLLAQRYGLVASSLEWMFLLMLAVSLLISFSNWMERRTRLILDEEGITFRNGLRKVTFRWPDIRRIRVLPASLGDGKSVMVMGEKTYFRFDTLGQARGRNREVWLGFPEGEQILSTLVARCGFSHHQDGKEEYYA